MAVEFISVKCPSCGAELSVEHERGITYCNYCGTKILIQNDREHVYRSIDEARIKEVESEQLLRLREMEIEEKDKERESNDYISLQMKVTIHDRNKDDREK